MNIGKLAPILPLILWATQMNGQPLGMNILSQLNKQVKKATRVFNNTPLSGVQTIINGLTDSLMPTKGNSNVPNGSKNPKLLQNVLGGTLSGTTTESSNTGLTTQRLVGVLFPYDNDCSSQNTPESLKNVVGGTVGAVSPPNLNQPLTGLQNSSPGYVMIEAIPIADGVQQKNTTDVPKNVVSNILNEVLLTNNSSRIPNSLDNVVVSASPSNFSEKPFASVENITNVMNEIFPTGNDSNNSTILKNIDNGMVSEVLKPVNEQNGIACLVTSVVDAAIPTNNKTNSSDVIQSVSGVLEEVHSLNKVEQLLNGSEIFLGGVISTVEPVKSVVGDLLPDGMKDVVTIVDNLVTPDNNTDNQVTSESPQEIVTDANNTVISPKNNIGNGQMVPDVVQSIVNVLPSPLDGSSNGEETTTSRINIVFDELLSSQSSTTESSTSNNNIIIDAAQLMNKIIDTFAVTAKSNVYEIATQADECLSIFFKNNR